MKVKQIWKSRMSLAKLFNDDSLDAALAWRLKGLARGLKELEEVHFELLQRFGEPQDDGRTYKIHKLYLTQFAQEFEALLAEDFMVDWKPVGRDELNGCKLSAMDYVNLDWLIVETLPSEEEPVS